MDTAATDTELIEACKRGDQAAFGQIVERYQRAVFAVSYSGTGDRALAEDVAQDTFVTAWRQLEALREIERLPAWLCGIARNVAQRTRKRRERETSIDDRDIAGIATAFDAVSERESDAVVTDALAKVPATYRDPLVLFYCEGQSVKDVARALGISEDATHQRLSRGRQYLAAGVTTLVEKSLTGAQSRRNLVAAVVGVIALGSAGHVEAATVTSKGSGMVKIGIGVAAAIVVAVGVKVVVSSHGSSGHSTHAHASTAPTSGHGASARTRGTPASDWIKLNRERMKHVAPAAGAPAAVETNPVPTCSETAGRYADFVIEAHGGIGHGGRPLVRDELVANFDKACTNTPWSSAYRRCIAAAASPVSLIGCRITTQSQDPAAPAVDPTTVSDKSCTAVAERLSSLFTPTAEALADLPEDARKEIIATIEQQHPQMLEELEVACTDDAWPESARACLASATHLAQLETCH